MARKEIQLECVICKNSFLSNNHKKKTCSNECRSKNISLNTKGQNNPNYGKKWTDEKKIKQSEIIKSKVNDNYREKVGSANRGIKFSPERIQKMHSNRSAESYSRLHTDESKRLIGIKSKQKFDEEFKKQYRKTMEERGFWKPLDKKEDIEIYFDLSNWKNRMFDLLYEEYKDLLETFGIYNSYSNTKGVVRDHRFSRQSGFELGVFPEILRHIENCEILEHSKNIRKRFKEKDSLSIDDLFKRIENTNHKWEEQELCLALIKEYKNGKRWKRKEV